MKKLFAVLTDINGIEHVAELSQLPDAPSTAGQAEVLVTRLLWVKVQDGRMLNIDHVVTFKVSETE